MKLCSACKQEKDTSEFYTDRRSTSGYSSQCKKCAKITSKRWYFSSEDHKQKVRSAGLKNRFGITQEDYFQMLEEQNGVCYICKERPSGNYLHVDHNHDTGVIRGLLCKSCNHGLGSFKDKTQYLLNAIEYLDRKIISK